MKASDATATLGYHRDWAAEILGIDSPAVAYLDVQIQKAPLGREEPVIAANSQVVGLLIDMHQADHKHLGDVKARALPDEIY